MRNVISRNGTINKYFRLELVTEYPRKKESILIFLRIFNPILLYVYCVRLLKDIFTNAHRIFFNVVTSLVMYTLPPSTSMCLIIPKYTFRSMRPAKLSSFECTIYLMLFYCWNKSLIYGHHSANSAYTNGVNIVCFTAFGSGSHLRFIYLLRALAHENFLDGPSERR